MTTTACDDQFSAEPEPDRQQYDVAAILRKNVADLEKDLQRQKERAEKAEANLAGSREDLQCWIESCNGWMERAHAAEMELKGLLEQVPLTFVHDPNGYALDGKHTEIADALPVGMDLYSRPIPAPAAPSVPEEWREVMAELADDLAIEIDQNYQPERRAYPSEQRKYAGEMVIVHRARALLQSASTGEPK